jgi:hypothetical protein
MKKSLTILTVALGLTISATVLLAGCAGYPSVSHYDPTYNYSPSFAPTEDSGGFLKPGYSIQPGANGGFNVYDSQGYRGTMDANGYYDNQGEGYTAWFIASTRKHHRR